MKEQLSAFLDNELSEFEERRLLGEIDRDPALRETWERYHLIRAAMRDELDLAADPATARRVTNGIEKDRLEKQRMHWLRPTAKMAGTLAIAASVAALTIVGLYTLNRQDGVPAQVAATGKPANNGPSTANARWNTGKPEVDRTLNSYLVEHNEFASTTGVGGVLPYVRVVGYEKNTVPDAPK
jgi:sigma-E factor negative regulatory protein RseA